MSDDWTSHAGGFLSRDESRFAAECLLALPIADREAKTQELFGDDPEILYPVAAILRERWDNDPGVVRDDAEYLYRFLEKIPRREKGSFKTGRFLLDERAYFLGEFALIAGTTSRFLSLRDQARQWFSRAENWFLMTKGAELNLSRLSYQRLALLIEERRFAEVVELLPALIEAFEEHEMAQDALKCRILEGQVFKETGRLPEAVKTFEQIRLQSRVMRNDRLLASACVNLSQLHAELNEAEQAIAVSQEAVGLLRRLGNRIGIAQTHCGIGLLLRRQGNAGAAIEAFRSAQMEFEDLGMRADLAALSLVIADLLLESGRDREAQKEIQAALPVIDEYKLVPEGIAALALLRQSLLGHRIDREALRDLHGYFGEE